MNYLSNKSKQNLITCDDEIIMLFSYALASSPIDFSVVEGYRGEEIQEKYFKEGKTKLHYPNSKHNRYPSLAVDIYPVKISYLKLGLTQEEAFIELSKHIKKCANLLNIKIKWGGDWSNFIDMPHWELI